MIRLDFIFVKILIINGLREAPQYFCEFAANL